MNLHNQLYSALGSSLEWLDFALYGYFAPIFSEIFFSEIIKSLWFNLIITYFVFAVGFMARPIGGIIFGYIGDKYGRTVALKITPLLFGGCILIISLLPTYSTIGVIAFVLLTITRIIQGIIIGGEFSGNIVYLCESSKKWKYFWGSIGSCTGSFGILLASFLATLSYSFGHHFAFNYGWRIAYLSSLPLVLLVFIMRLKMSEPLEFYGLSSINPIIHTMKKYKKTVCYCIGIICLHATSFYFTFMFIPIFLTKIRHLSETASLLNNSSFLILHIMMIPIFSLIVNLIGGLRALLGISIVFTLISIPTFFLIAYGPISAVILGIFVFSALTAFNAAIIPGLLVKLIDNSVRYIIIGFSFNLSFGIFGGLVPFLGLLLIQKVHCIMAPAFYLTFTSMITLSIGYILFKKGNHETRRI